jgi:hypothetical protein
MKKKSSKNSRSASDDRTDSQRGALISVSVEECILVIRGQKAILDADLARLYGVTTKALNQAVRRNLKRFPRDFMFKLTKEEKEEVVTNCDHLKNIKYSHRLPQAFTEHGAVMAATVLNSQRAMEVSIYVVRAFVHLRSMVAAQKEIMERLDKLEGKIETHDHSIRSLFDAIRRLMEPKIESRKKIGFDLSGRDD